MSNNTGLFDSWLLNQNNLTLVQVIQTAVSVAFSIAIAMKSYDWTGAVRKYKAKQDFKIKEKEKRQLEKFKKMMELATGKEIQIDIKDETLSSESETKVSENVLKIAHRKRRPGPPVSKKGDERSSAERELDV